MSKGENKQNGKKTFDCCNQNIWMPIGIVLGIAFVITLIFALTSSPSGTTAVGIGTTAASNIVVDLLHKNQPDLNIIVKSAEETNGLYKIELTAGGETVEVFVSIDGKFLFPTQPIDLAPQVVDTNVSKNYVLPETINQAPVLGDPNSKIEVLEFSDYQCPFCGLAYGSPWASEFASQYGPMIGTVKKLENEYAKTNKIAFRQFPVAINTSGGSTESIDASNAALCANDQGKYWEMHDALFEANTKEEYNGKYAKDNLKTFGSKISGLDLTKFNECVDKDTYVDLVENMTDDVGKAAYANTGSFGTPTFYIVLDASFSKEKIESVLAPIRAEIVSGNPNDKTSYTFAPASNGLKYVIIADAKFANLKKVIDAFAS